MENHRNVVVGVTALAIVALFWTFFAVGIIGAAAVRPPEPTGTVQDGQVIEEIITIGDYLTPGRLVVSLIVGVAGSAAMWAWVDLRLYSTSRYDHLLAPEAEDASPPNASQD